MGEADNRDVKCSKILVHALLDLEGLNEHSLTEAFVSRVHYERTALWHAIIKGKMGHVDFFMSAVLNSKLGIENIKESVEGKSQFSTALY